MVEATATIIDRNSNKDGWYDNRKVLLYFIATYSSGMIAKKFENCPYMVLLHGAFLLLDYFSQCHLSFLPRYFL